MVKLFFYIFCITLISSSGHCYVATYQYLFEYEIPANLKISVGDIVCCRIESNHWAQIYGAEHVMLALSSISVAHISLNDGDLTRGSLKTDNFISMTRAKSYSSCRIANSQYDRTMLDLGKSLREPENAVTAALSDVGRSVYYDRFGCNCQHWVTKWRYGAAWSVQSNQAPNKECEMPNVFMNKATASASSYNRNNQLSARANAGIMEENFAQGVFSGQLKGPNAGAHAELGLHNTGAGFDLGVVETDYRLGETVGATLGLNFNTKAGIGIDGTKLLVLGTGMEITRTDGFKMCIFGNCLKIKLG